MEEQFKWEAYEKEADKERRGKEVDKKTAKEKLKDRRGDEEKKENPRNRDELTTSENKAAISLIVNQSNSRCSYKVLKLL